MSRMPERTTSDGETAQRVRKILCLDGGGVRGLSSLMVLRYIMYLLSIDRGIDIEPWQEFDMICGTSTGGLAAIMLGRMRMSINEVEEAYIKLSNELFTPVRSPHNPRQVYDFLQASGKFSSEPLKRNVKTMLRDKKYKEEELLQDLDPDSCKVFVCAVRAENSDPVLIRSYKSRAFDNLYGKVKIWEAAGATSAASTFFEPMTIGDRGQKFVDGGIRYNNPIEMAYLESNALWPNETRMIISIGTGCAPGQAIEGNVFNLAHRLADIVLDADETSNRFRASHPDMVEDNRLFRFTVSQGLGNIGLEEHKAVNKISTYTETYLNNPDVVRLVEACVRTMKLSGQRLNLTAADYENLPMNQLINEIVRICSTCLIGQPAKSTLFFCRECRVLECASCRDFHEPKHADIWLRFVIIQWNKSMDNVSLTKACHSCSRSVRSRFECTQCGRALCDFCGSFETTQNAWFEEHNAEFPHHKSFISIAPPNFSMPSMMKRDCNCVEDQNVVDHCNRCLACLKYGDTMYWCITCRNIYGAAVKSCRKCYQEELSKHEGHKYQNIYITKPDSAIVSSNATAVDQITKCWQCFDCENVVPHANFARHPCTNMSLVVGQALLDGFRVGFARCLRLAEPKWPFTEIVATPIQCPMCTDYVIYDVWSLICLTCPTTMCKKCLLKGRREHEHPTSLCKVVSGHPSLRLGDVRTCRSCNIEYPSREFLGIQCIHCRSWECCYSCLVKRRCPPHLQCHGRFTIWNLILPKSALLSRGRNESRTSKIIRGLTEKPQYAIGLTMLGLLGAAAAERMTNDSDSE